MIYARMVEQHISGEQIVLAKRGLLTIIVLGFVEFEWPIRELYCWSDMNWGDY